MTIVPDTAIEKDPRQILYHYPSLPAIKFAKMAQNFYFKKTIKALEEVCRLNNSLLVPASCIHQKRKEKYIDRSIKVGRNRFYILKKDEMTELEIKKYKKIAHKMN